MKREARKEVGLAAGCRWAVRVGALVVSASLAGCGGGSGGTGAPPAPGGGPPSG